MAQYHSFPMRHDYINFHSVTLEVSVFLMANVLWYVNIFIIRVITIIITIVDYLVFRHFLFSSDICVSNIIIIYQNILTSCHRQHGRSMSKYTHAVPHCFCLNISNLQAKWKKKSFGMNGYILFSIVWNGYREHKSKISP